MAKMKVWMRRGGSYHGQTRAVGLLTGQTAVITTGRDEEEQSGCSRLFISFQIKNNLNARVKRHRVQLQ